MNNLLRVMAVMGLAAGWGMLPSSAVAQQLSVEDLAQYEAREVGPSATGGRIVDIAVNPENVNHIFVAAASGGLWETRNNGTTWECLFQNEGTLSIGDIALNPKDSSNIWVGTGEANNQRSSLWGDGVYKTVDGGKTWQNMGLRDTQHIGRIVVHPENPDVVYVAALGHLYSFNDERGLFKTTDGGNTWEKVLFISERVGVVDVVMDPADPDTLYAASYERLRRAWDFDGNGPGSAIYKTSDGGKNWTRLENGLPTGDIGRIGLAIYPGDPQVVYASVANQNVVASDSNSDSRSDENTQSNPSPGDWNPVFYHEDGDAEAAGSGSESAGRDSRFAQQEQDEEDADADQEDAQEDDAQDETPNIRSARPVPWDVELDELETPFGFSLKRSDDGVVIDGLRRTSAIFRQGVRNGAIVERLAGIPAAQLAQIQQLLDQLDPRDTVTLVCQTDEGPVTIELSLPTDRSARTRSRQVGGEVYKSTDGGKSWTKVNRRAAGGSPAYYYGQIRVDPQNADQLYMLSVPVYVSEDGGQNWRTDGASSVHVDHHALWINPQNSDHLMLGNDGGFHISYDRGKTWDHVFNLNLAQFYAIGVDMQRPYHIYGGLQDNGTWGGPSRGRVGKFDWYRVGGGDGFYVQVDPTDTDIIYGESQFGVIYRVNRATGVSKSIRPPASDPGGVADRYNWNSPIVVSHHNPSRIYFGGNKLFRSHDRGDSWEVASPDLTTADPDKLAGNVPHCTITTISESPLDGSMLLVGTDDGKLQLTRDGGTSWEDLSDRLPWRPALWWCSRVEWSHHDTQVAYASFTGYREDDFRSFVFKTVDGGKTWSSITRGLPRESVNVIKEDHENPNLLFAGTEMGVYVSLDAGANWHPFVSDLPRVSVHDLVIHPRDNDLVIGTHGRGMFIVDNITALQRLQADVADDAVTLLAPRDEYLLGREFGRSGGISGDRQWRAEDAASAASLCYVVGPESSAEKIQLKVMNLDGDEVASFDGAVTPGLHMQQVRLAPAAGARRGRGGRGGEQRRSRILRPGQYSVRLWVDGKEVGKAQLKIESP